MSIYKKIDNKDGYISTYEANKEYILSGSQLIDNGIVFVPYGEAPLVQPSPTPTSTVSPTPTTSPSPSVSTNKPFSNT